MNMSARQLTKTVSLLLVAGLLGPMITNAAEEAPARGRPADRGAGGPGGAGGAGGFGGMRGGAGMLDEKQREVLREAVQSHRDEIRKFDEQLMAAQKELMKAVLAEKQDEKVIREKAEIVAKIQVEQTMIRAKIIASVSPTLKPEQRAQLEQSPYMLGALTSGMGGMGGMRVGPAARPDAGGGRPGRGQGGDRQQ